METLSEEFTVNEIAENHKVFEERARLYRECGVDQEAMRRLFVSQLDGVSGPILEIGTGRGLLSIMMAGIFDSIVSIDTDAESQRIARLNAAHYAVSDKVRFITADAADLDFPDGSFGAAVSAFTFHHLEYPFKVIREMVRVSDGHIVISDFNSRGFEAIQRIHARDGRTHERGTGDFDIVGVFLRELGFEVRIIKDDMQTIYSAVCRV